MLNNTSDKKVKILLLGYNDNPLKGHVLSHYQELPEDKFDKRMVVAFSLDEKKDYAFHVQSKSVWAKIWKKFDIRLTRIKNIIRYRSFIQINKKRPEFCFLGFDRQCNVTAKEILDKNPDFVPDVIALFWTATFLNPKIIRDLHDITGAKILFVFVDEAYLTGGCHYPNDCEGYLYGCHKCPALSIGKNVAELQMADKLKYWEGIPKIVYGVKSDCILAKKTPVFKDAITIALIAVPNVTITDRSTARRKWGIDANSFVMLLGANDLRDTRKGIKYAIKAINKLAEEKDNLCVFILGHKKNHTINKLGIKSNVKIIAPGFLSLNDLFIAYCASDCHISPSLADSGPMMVNYSIACGTPVVSYNIGVARDIVLHKETGYIAKYKDSNDIANGLNWLYQLDENSKETMRKNCLALMEELKKQRPYYDDVYDYVVKGNKL